MLRRSSDGQVVLQVQPLPGPLWSRNPGRWIKKRDRDRLEALALDQAERVCEVCERPALIAQPDWNVDIEAKVRTLDGYVALCAECADVVELTGRRNLTQFDLQRAASWLVEVNGWSRARAATHVEEAVQEQSCLEFRSIWEVDLDWFRRMGATLTQGARFRL